MAAVDQTPASETAVAEPAENDADVVSPAPVGSEPSPTAGLPEPSGDIDGAPRSRRERRMAEQGEGPSAASPAAAAAASAFSSPPSMSPPATGQRPSLPTSLDPSPSREGPRRGTSKAFSLARALFYLLLISTLVLGTGTVLSGRDESKVGPSATDTSRQAGWEKTTELMAQVTSLGAATGDPQLQELMRQIGQSLTVQATALGNGLPAFTPAAPATIPAPMTLTQFATALQANGEELLTQAMSADYAMGRVFAAVGTSQLLHSRNLSVASGAAPPPSRFLPPRIDFPAAVGPACTSTLEPRAGATIDAALRAAALAEQQAVYAYQVATTRFAEPQFGSAAQLLARHQQKLQTLNTELVLRCLPPATPVAGFALDPAFTATPGKALAQLEAELSGIYGDLAALSAAPAVSTITPARTGAATSSSNATPSGQPSITSSLREISVIWLLDSALTQSFWGSPLSALPGLAQAPSSDPQLP